MGIEQDMQLLPCLVSLAGEKGLRLEHSARPLQVCLSYGYARGVLVLMIWTQC